MQNKSKNHGWSLKVKVVALMLLFAIMLSVGTVVISYSTYTRSFNEHYEKLATSISKTSASVLDVKQAADLINEVKKVYHNVCNENGGVVPNVENYSESELENYYSKFEYI
ncbi:MAG: hypothetical protein K5917_01170, partial [Clostridiales bacterium]|nr:hypothetical protein [Clostridiales bacterium]